MIDEFLCGMTGLAMGVIITILAVHIGERRGKRKVKEILTDAMLVRKDLDRLIPALQELADKEDKK